MRTIRYMGIAVLLIIPAAGNLLAQGHFSQISEREQRIAEETYLSTDLNLPVYRYEISTTINNDETVSGHLVLTSGDLVDNGTVRGDVLVMDGKVIIGPRAVIGGNVTAIDGRVTLDPEATVRGTIRETHWKNLLPATFATPKLTYGRPASYSQTEYALPGDRSELLFRYNRVEGVFLGISVPKKFQSPSRRWSSFGFFGYGFENSRWRYQFGLARWLFNPLPFKTELGGEAHDLTDTKDAWRISEFENTMAALFLRKDFQDYFRRTGFSVYFSQNLSASVQTRLSYAADKYRDMPIKTNWALFGGDRRFRINPPLGLFRGTIRSLSAEFTLDTRNVDDANWNGWYAYLGVEKATPGLRSDFDFERYLLEVRRHQRITHGENLTIRLLLGTSAGQLPRQKNFELGGLSTLRGYDYKIFSGNRMFLTNLEYKLNMDATGINIPVVDDLIEQSKLILFSDAGLAWNDGKNKAVFQSFRFLKFRRLKYDVGLGIANSDESFRINFAKALSSSDNDIVVNLRIRQAF